MCCGRKRLLCSATCRFISSSSDTSAGRFRLWLLLAAVVLVVEEEEEVVAVAAPAGFRRATAPGLSVSWHMSMGGET